MYTHNGRGVRERPARKVRIMKRLYRWNYQSYATIKQVKEAIRRDFDEYLAGRRGIVYTMAGDNWHREKSVDITVRLRGLA